MLFGIRDILIISTITDIKRFDQLLADGSQFGLHFSYIVQEKPGGLPEAFILGANFIGNDSVALILGDNIFYGQHFTEVHLNASSITSGLVIFSYFVKSLSRFSVVDFEKKNVLSLEEKS